MREGQSEPDARDDSGGCVMGNVSPLVWVESKPNAPTRLCSYKNYQGVFFPHINSFCFLSSLRLRGAAVRSAPPLHLGCASDPAAATSVYKHSTHLNAKIKQTECY